MRVAFYKVDGGRLCGWAAAPPKRKRFQGSTMASGRDLPHDLAQFVVEQTLGLELGFWGLLAQGASFKSVPGRRLTKPGREIARTHARQLDAAEAVANAHINAWRSGVETLASAALSAMLARWRALGVDERLELDWGLAPRGRRTSSRS
jgi:hypothetical protein